MINFDGKQLQEEFNEAFGCYQTHLGIDENGKENFQQLQIDKLTLKQLWWLVKFAKHVRGRCRNNSAFNNFMNRNFTPAKFSEVPKEYKGKQYTGLKITVGNESSDGGDGEE